MTSRLEAVYLSTQRAWSTLTVPVRDPVGNWQDVTVGNTFIDGIINILWIRSTWECINRVAGWFAPCTNRPFHFICFTFHLKSSVNGCSKTYIFIWNSHIYRQGTKQMGNAKNLSSREKATLIKIFFSLFISIKTQP